MVDYTGPRDFVSGRFGSSPNRSPRVRPPRPGIFGRTEFRTRGWAPRRNSRLDRHPDPLDRSSLSISQLASCPRANPLLGGSGQRNRRTSSSPPRLQRGGNQTEATCQQAAEHMAERRCIFSIGAGGEARVGCYQRSLGSRHFLSAKARSRFFHVDCDGLCELFSI